MKKTIEVDFANLLKSKNLKVTPTRVAILEIFNNTKTPLDAKTLWTKVKKDKSVKDTNEATVYRTISSFEEEGILKKVDLRKDSVYFELKTEHHHHIVCTNCDTVEDFENLEVEKVLSRIAAKSSKFKNIKDHSLELFGLCKVCS